MKIFCKDKFLAKTKDPELYQNGFSWPDKCHGRAVEGTAIRVVNELGFTQSYSIMKEWCIDSIDIVDYFKSNNIAVKIDSDLEYETFMHILKEHDVKWISGKECSRKSKTIIPERFRNDSCLSYVTMTLYGFCVVEGLTWGTPKDFEFTQDTVISYSELIDRVYNEGKSKEVINDYVNKNPVYHHSYCDKLTRVIKKISLNDTNPSDTERSTFEKNTKAPGYDIQITSDGKRPSIFYEDSKPVGLEMKSLEDGYSFILTPVNDVFEEIRKSIHQGMVDGVMNQPYDIHISSDGKTTAAKFYVNGKVVREAEARCHPNDRFNFHTGAEVAFNRLFEKQPKEKKIGEAEMFEEI